MKLSFLILLFSIILPAAHAQAGKSIHQPDHQTIASWEKKGWCYAYLGAWNSEKSLAPCKHYCKGGNSKDGPNDLSCKLVGISAKDVAKQGFLYTDDDGKEFVPGECECNLAWLGDLVLKTLEGLEKLDDILCGVFATTIDIILEVALSATPVGQLKRIGTFIKGAKTFAENGLGVADFFGGWITPVCGKDWNKEVEPTVFEVLAHAPDDLGTSAGCMRAEGCVQTRDFAIRRAKGGSGKKKGGSDKKKNDPKPKDEKPKPKDEKPKPKDEKPKPKDEKPKPKDEKPKPKDEKPKPKDEKPRPKDEKPKPTETKPKPTETKPKPTEKKPKSESTKHENKTTTKASKSATKSTAHPTSTKDGHKSIPTNHSKSKTTQHGPKSKTTDRDSKSTTTKPPKSTVTNKDGKSTYTKPSKSTTNGTLKSTSTHKSTKVSSTKTQQPSATPSSCSPSKQCKRGKGGKGNEKCAGGCAKIQAWEPEFFNKDDSANLAIRGTGFFGLGMRELAKRDYKDVKLCGIEVRTENYPSGGELMKTKGISDDIIYALEDPTDCGNFDFGKRSNNMHTVYTDPDLSNGLRLATEHVIEAQLIDQFFTNTSKTLKETLPDPFDKSGKKKVDLCTYIKAFWAQWIADQYPTTHQWPEEFLLLPNDVNRLKADVWKTKVKNIVGSAFLDPLTKAQSIHKNDFLKTKELHESKHVIALVKFKDMMSVYRYHNEPRVIEIFKKQSGRISSILETLEDAMESLPFGGQNTPHANRYKPQGLSLKWKTWIKQHADYRMSVFDSFFTTNYPKFVQARIRLEAELKKLKDKKSKKPLDCKAQERYELVIGYHNDAEAAYTDMRTTAWTNPF
ncbi:uncharacterized protein GIQ15_01894 [Arthroderma uncinatum]|uniref:uncharacterized protein n=1 Tax=Arthroderma uncinatum TaxID=74035 RepID=UPI00144A986E|nr:uncharacterized protein GIQ15_01894 [Arthroderma uncinatum]KAF3492377.1 hypothetical protein GIQ15_01894 [Arthroderma uncinatum]